MRGALQQDGSAVCTAQHYVTCSTAQQAASRTKVKHHKQLFTSSSRPMVTDAKEQAACELLLLFCPPTDLKQQLIVKGENTSIYDVIRNMRTQSSDRALVWPL